MTEAWRQLGALLRQRYPGLTDDEAHDLALLLLARRGGARKALTTGSGAPLVQQDLEGARERGTPAFEQRWKALTEILQQTYPALTPSEARKAAHLLLTRRGATRPAYVSIPPGAYRQ